MNSPPDNPTYAQLMVWLLDQEKDDRYFIKADVPGAEWTEVDRGGFAKAERAAGFFSRYGHDLATSGFSGRGIVGMIVSPVHWVEFESGSGYLPEDLREKFGPAQVEPEDAPMIQSCDSPESTPSSAGPADGPGPGPRVPSAPSVTPRAVQTPNHRPESVPWLQRLAEALREPRAWRLGPLRVSWEVGEPRPRPPVPKVGQGLFRGRDGRWKK